MYKIATIVGTRPEIIKLSLVLKKLDQHTDHVFIHTGQNYDYELNEIFFEDLEIRKPDYFLNAAGKSAIETIAETLIKVDQVLEETQPDAVLLYGDTNSCISALAAKRRKIPIFHMEAGNRCFDQRVPEEINRKLVDHLSDINMPLTEHGRRNLLQEGFPSNFIFKSGSCMKEVLSFFSHKINDSDVLDRLNLNAQSYFIVSAHREENVDSNEKLHTLVSELNAISETHQCPIIFSVHPRTQKKLDSLKNISFHPNVQTMKPLGFCDYIQLQSQAKCVISDSGTLMEESSILGFRALHIRDAFERPEAMDVGTAMVIPLKHQLLSQSLQISLSQTPQKGQVKDYEHQKVSDMVVNVILSHIEMVNRTVWKKSI